VDDAHEKEAFGQGRQVRRRTRDLPRHPCERRREAVFDLVRPRQLDAQGALALRPPQPVENLVAEHILGDGDAQLRQRRRLLIRVDQTPQAFAKIEQRFEPRDAQAREFGPLVPRVRAGGVFQGEFSREVGGIRCDDEVEVEGHSTVPSRRQ
jgi:hypothetical protein